MFKKLFVTFFLLTILGCDEGTNKLLPPTTGDLMFKEKLVGTWDVVSVNDIEPSRFLTVLIAKTLDEDVSVAEEDVPAAPDGEFVVIEDELQEVFHVQADVQKFHYTFDTDDLWTLHVQFNVLPNDEAPPVDAGDASDPGGAQNDPVDPNKPAAPAANGANEAFAIVVGTWSGTYQVAEDMLTLTTVSEEARVTPHPDTKDTFEEIAGATEAETQAELTEKFWIRLITPFHKTFIEIDDDGRLTLKIPGSSRGKMILEKR